jgi:DNA-directed RNA polymerase subunit beta
MIYQTEEATKDLDENGMIRIGAEVKPGDILMEKLLQRRIRSYSRRELLRAIFGDKAGDVKDASLKRLLLYMVWFLIKKLFARAVKTKYTQDKDALGAFEWI